MNFNFGEVLTRAWQIVWKHKVLWIFGILASCNTNRGSVNFNNNFNVRDNAPANLPPQFLHQMDRLTQNIVPVIAILLAVICVMAIIAIFLGTIGRIGLIRGTVAAEGGAEGLSFGELYRESTPFFWRSFWLWFLVGLPFAVFALLLAAVIAVGVFTMIQNGADETALLGMLGMLPVLLVCSCIIGVFGWLVRLIAQQAQNAIVVEDLGTLPALQRGWDVFKQNLGPVFLMAIILAVIGFAVNLVIAIPIMIIVFPAMVAFFVGGGESTTPLLVMGLCLVAFIPVSILISGILNAYSESAWTLTFLRLTRKPIEPSNDPVIVLPEPNA